MLEDVTKPNMALVSLQADMPHSMLQIDFANVHFNGRGTPDLPQTLQPVSGSNTQPAPHAPVFGAPAQSSEGGSGVLILLSLQLLRRLSCLPGPYPGRCPTYAPFTHHLHPGASSQTWTDPV